MITIIIPARFASTRLPGKPLQKIAGQSMLSRVCKIAKLAAQKYDDVEYYVAVDHNDVQAHCEEIGAPYIVTRPECRSGSDRAFEAANKLPYKPELIINLQGDAPLTPPSFIEKIIESYKAGSNCDVFTPYEQLSWSDLDKLRETKKETPFSGTTVTMNADKKAFWFSKQIIPAVRKEDKLKEASEKSPIARHIGLYAYKYEALQNFVQKDEGFYEKLEGLEQLRFLENGMSIQMVEVSYGSRQGMSGVDSPEDVTKAEAIILKDGEF